MTVWVRALRHLQRRQARLTGAASPLGGAPTSTRKSFQLVVVRSVPEQLEHMLIAYFYPEPAARLTRRWNGASGQVSRHHDGQPLATDSTEL